MGMGFHKLSTPTDGNLCLPTSSKSTRPVFYSRASPSDGTQPQVNMLVVFFSQHVFQTKKTRKYNVDQWIHGNPWMLDQPSAKR